MFAPRVCPGSETARRIFRRRRNTSLSPARLRTNEAFVALGFSDSRTSQPRRRCHRSYARKYSKHRNPAAVASGGPIMQTALSFAGAHPALAGFSSFQPRESQFISRPSTSAFPRVELLARTLPFYKFKPSKAPSAVAAAHERKPSTTSSTNEGPVSRAERPGRRSEDARCETLGGPLSRPQIARLHKNDAAKIRR